MGSKAPVPPPLSDEDAYGLRGFIAPRLEPEAIEDDKSWLGMFKRLATVLLVLALFSILLGICSGITVLAFRLIVHE